MLALVVSVLLGVVFFRGAVLRRLQHGHFDSSKNEAAAIETDRVARDVATHAKDHANAERSSGVVEEAAVAAHASPPPRIVLRKTAAIPPERVSFLQNLKPREVLPKEPLHIPPGDQLRLTVKFADDLVARALNDGRLSVESAHLERFQGINRVATAHDLKFHRVQTATDEQIAELEQRAAVNTGVSQPDLGGLLEVTAPGLGKDQVIALAHELHRLPEVEYAELASLDKPPPPPASDIAPTTPLLVGSQTYRNAATGVNVDHVWNTYGIRGDTSLKVTDCEYDCNTSHEDLSGLVQMQPGVVSRYTGFGDNHGTAVLGILASGWNSYGTTGSAPECITRFYPEYSDLTSGFQDRTACVIAAMAASASGDIVVLEMQTDGAATGSTDYVPAEYSNSVWTAVKAGTDAGVIVIAAAGNGNQNLDGTLYTTYRNRGDSGAIIVGAGNASRVRQSYSTHGSRVNVQGWGTGVFTTGYGDYATYGADANQRYTATFSGTSSATPVVTSAAALLQSVAIKIIGTRLTPLQIRSLLTSTGRAQTGSDAATAPIGPLPELLAATNSLLSSNPPSFASTSSWGHYYFATATPDLTADTDADGFSNLLEYMLGTNPKGHPPGDASLEPKVFIEHPSPLPDRMVFEFNNPPARTGVTWVVQGSDSLSNDSWQNLVHGVGGVTIARVGNIIRVTTPAEGSGARKFLRLRVTKV